ncbi:unnamed protein product [Symbiodinium sp. KB8]|nr:unnamed protein product [Symbiodinium sp. KB8]
MWPPSRTQSGRATSSSTRSLPLAWWTPPRLGWRTRSSSLRACYDMFVQWATRAACWPAPIAALPPPPNPRPFRQTSRG